MYPDRALLYRFSLIVILVILPSSYAADGASTFIRLQFGADASIEVPRNWTFFNKKIREHLNTAGEANARLSGINANQGDNQILVAANAYTNDKKPSATMRLSVRIGTFPSQSDIKYVNQDALRKKSELIMKKMRRSLPQNVKDMKLIVVRIGRLGAYYTITTKKQVNYLSGLEIDRLDVIYFSNKVYKLNTSYRKSEAWLFKPIIKYIRQSLTISAK